VKCRGRPSVALFGLLTVDTRRPFELELEQGTDDCILLSFHFLFFFNILYMYSFVFSILFYFFNILYVYWRILGKLFSQL